MRKLIEYIREMIMGRSATGIPVSTLPSSVHTIQVCNRPNSLTEWSKGIEEELVKIQKEQL